jgi:hypothetical protein
VAEHGIVDEAGTPQPILKHLGTMLNTAAGLCDRLALTPAGRAGLGLALGPATPARYDFSKLSDEELATLHRLL